MVKLTQVLKKGIWQGAVLVILATALALAVNAVRPDGLPLQHRPAEPKVHKGRVSDIALPDALGLFHKRGALFLDARDSHMFSQGHIPGALNVPPDKGADFVVGLKESPDKLIITYCSDQECGLAEKLASVLNQAGLTNIRIMREGWMAWSGSGYPVDAPDMAGK
jgi:rhodanese-related sulfurtransferase